MASNLCTAGVKTTGETTLESHNCAFTNDGKLWFVGLKGAEQKKYSFYHRTALLGSYLAALNLKTETWDPRVEFGELDSDENREDVLLGLGDKLYMLIYSRYDGFQFRKLLIWTEKAWKEVQSVKIQPETQFKEGRCHLAHVQDQSTGSVYFFVTGEKENTVKISKLDMQSVDSATITHVMDVSESTANIRMGWITMAGYHENTIYAVAGEMMCGFHWQPQHLLKVNLATKTAESLEVSAGRPPFAFSGPHGKVQLNDGRWVLVGGSLARGMESTEFSREIWMMDFKEGTPGWKKIDKLVPNEIREYEMCVATDGTKVFVADTEHCFALAL